MGGEGPGRSEEGVSKKRGRGGDGGRGGTGTGRGRRASSVAGGPGADCEHRCWKIWACPASSLVFLKPRSRPAGWGSTAGLRCNSRKSLRPQQPAGPAQPGAAPAVAAAAGAVTAGAGRAGARSGRGRFPVARGRAAPGTRLRHTSGRGEAFLLRNPPDSSDALCFYSGKLQLTIKKK